MLFFIAIIINYGACERYWPRVTLKDLCGRDIRYKFTCNAKYDTELNLHETVMMNQLRTTDDLPQTKVKKLNIHYSDTKGLCLERDKNAECGAYYKNPRSGNSLLRGITSVKLDWKIKYISPKLFYFVFENIEELVITQYSSPTITIPITKKSLKKFVISGRNLETVNVDQDLLPITEHFTIVQWFLDTDPPLELFKLGQIKGGPSMKEFIVQSKADTTEISLPIISSESNIEKVKISYQGKNPDNVKLSYKGTEGNIKLMEFEFKSDKHKAVKHLLPPISKIDNVAKITVKYESTYQTYIFEEWDFHKSIAANMKVVTKEEDSSSLKLFSKLLPIKISKGTEAITVDFIIADIATIMQSTSEKGNSYIVNTYFLVLDEMYSDESLLLVSDVTINFRVLIVVDYKRFFGYRLDQTKRIKFKQSKSIMDIWKPFTIESFYAIITGLVDAIKPSFMTENESFLKVRRAIANSLLDDIDTEEVKKKFKSDTSYNYLDNALKKINELRLFFNTIGKKARRLPRLTPSLYKEKTLIYHEMAKSLIAAGRYSDSNAGQGILLDISERKSKTEKKIAIRLQQLLGDREKGSLATLQKLKSLRKKYEAEYKKNSKKFDAAIKRREREAILDAVMSVFSAITSLFSGSLSALGEIGDAAEAIKKLVKTITKIKALISRINTIIETLGGLVTSVMGTYNKINVVEEGHNPKFKNVKPKEISYKSLDKTSKDFDQSKVDDVTKKLSQLDAADVLEWDLAAKQVEGMMDASLSAEVPETLSYKTAILKMVTAGKAETEASIRFAQLKSEILLNEYKIASYDSEIEFIGNARKSLSAKTTNDFQKNLNLSGMQLKLDLFLHIIDYCDSAFYYNLQPCFVFSEFSFGDSLSQVMYNSNKILAQSIANMNDLFPPPQSFFDKSIKLSIIKGCENTMKQYEETVNSNACNIDFASSGCKEALQAAMPTLIPIDNPKDKQSRQFYEKLENMYPANLKNPEKDVIIFQRMYMDCLSSNIQEMKTKNETTISISIDNEEFKSFDRVRIDVIKVILNGLKSNSEFLQVEVENQGLVEDRLCGKKFVFVGDKWNRIIRYKPDISGIKYEVKGNVHGEFSQSFNNPTPFSTWRISVSEKYNPGLDLNGLTSIELIFSGSFMSDESCASEESKERE